MELSIVDGDSANLLRFNLPVLSREKRVQVATAYVLMDGGASHKFVTPSMVAAIEAAGERLQRRNMGHMQLTSAGKVENLPRVQVKLTISFGRFRYSGWFTLYKLVKYDMILGKDWMEEIKHDIDHATNILTLHPASGSGPSVHLRGLAKGVGREGGLSKEEDVQVEKEDTQQEDAAQQQDTREESQPELMVVESMVGRIDVHEVSPSGLPITACRELHSARCTHPVSDRTRSLANLTPAQSVAELFTADMDEWVRKEYADLFKEPDGLPPHRPRFGDFRIRLLPGSKAPYRSPYRLTPAEWEEYKRQIKLYGDKGYIRRSRSPYAAPVLFVPKPGGAPGELRMVIDYRALNAITVKDRFPLPLPEELIDKLQGKKFFSKMDFWSGYSQNRVASEDIEKTAFVGPDGLWE
jgi:hypothetical protein